MRKTFPGYHPVGGLRMDERKKGRIQSLSEAWIVITLFFLFCDRAKSILTICMPVRLLTGAASWKIGPKSPYNTWPAENPHGGFCGRPKNICGGIIQREKGRPIYVWGWQKPKCSAKIFLPLLFQQNRGHKATHLSGLASFTITDNGEGK